MSISTAADVIRDFEEVLESPVERLCTQLYFQARGIIRMCDRAGTPQFTARAAATILEQQRAKMAAHAKAVVAAIDEDPSAYAQAQAFRGIVATLSRSTKHHVRAYVQATDGNGRREELRRIRGRAELIAANAALRILDAGRARLAVSEGYFVRTGPPPPEESPSGSPERCPAPTPADSLSEAEDGGRVGRLFRGRPASAPRDIAGPALLRSRTRDNLAAEY